MKCLYIDCCIREGSNTKKISDAFINNLKGYEIKHLILENEDLKPLSGKFFSERQELLEKGQLDHHRFRYAKEFKDADLIVLSAPFWDLSFPALFKIYIENISVDSITFGATEDGLKGLCKADKMIYFVSRGGFYDNDSMESAIPQLKNLCKFFGINELISISADGMNVASYDYQKSLDKAINKAIELSKELSI